VLLHILFLEVTPSETILFATGAGNSNFAALSISLEVIKELFL
jgi:hypothetical protein